MVGKERNEPLKRVGDIVEAGPGVEVVPVNEGDSNVVVPDEVPGARIAVAVDDDVGRDCGCTPGGVGWWLPVLAGVVDSSEQPRG